MRKTEIIIGMPVVLEVVDAYVADEDLERVFAFFRDIDAQFSPFKPESEVSRFGRGEVSDHAVSSDLREVLRLADITRRETDGYFDVYQNGHFDPSGLVKGWAIQRASALLDDMGFDNTYVEAGGDIQVRGKNADGEPWRIGIRHPFQLSSMVKVVALTDHGIATSGTYERGQHIVNPKTGKAAGADIVSTTVIAPTLCDADRFATAAFAMGKNGIVFLEHRPALEGFQIDTEGNALMTPGFSRYIV